MSQTVPRAYALDLLPAITDEKAEIFIKTIEDKALSWTVYLNPFSNEMWLVLFLVSVVISLFLTSIEKWFCIKDQEFTPMNYLTNLWVALKANAGGKPSKLQKNTIHQTGNALGIWFCGFRFFQKRSFLAPPLACVCPM